MVSPTDFVIPPGSLVLVTAANSYIGAHVVDLLLGMGYKVRGTVRNFHKCRWLLDYFDNKYGKGAFELVVVEDMAAGGAYINAIKGTPSIFLDLTCLSAQTTILGVAGVVHVASPTQTALDPERVVPIAVNGVLEALNSAMNESNILRFVLTSSSVAVVEPAQAQKSIVTSDMWNEEAVEQVRAPSPHNQNRALAVYAASKVKSEQAMWEWKTNSRPSFTANSGRVIFP
jgi:nucleoside-diphosphate-sugar epimerase